MGPTTTDTYVGPFPWNGSSDSHQYRVEPDTMLYVELERG